MSTQLSTRTTTSPPVAGTNPADESNLAAFAPAAEPWPIRAAWLSTRSHRSSRRLLASSPAAELATAAQAGDAEAAGELYRRVHGRARRAAVSFCLDLDADDAVAEGLFTALRRIGQLRDPAAVESWMVRCVVRAAIDLSRQRLRQAPSVAVDPVIADGPRFAESAAERAMSALERDSMADVLQGLQPGLRLLLYLRYEAGVSVEHIAFALGKPAGTVRRQCVEARRTAAQQFLSRHLRPAAGACAEVTTFLCQQPFRRQANRVRSRTAEHLRRCHACRDRQAELAAVLAELGSRRGQFDKESLATVKRSVRSSSKPAGA